MPRALAEKRLGHTGTFASKADASYSGLFWVGPMRMARIDAAKWYC